MVASVKSSAGTVKQEYCLRHRPQSSVVPDERRTNPQAGTDTHEYKPEIKHEYTHAAEYVTPRFPCCTMPVQAQLKHPAEMAAMQHYHDDTRAICWRKSIRSQCCCKAAVFLLIAVVCILRCLPL
uniref:Transmembrane protein n=1 Tax=Haemonchus contortus TaxID=6289 RepID=A0A7I5EB40_HAECO